MLKIYNFWLKLIGKMQWDFFSERRKYLFAKRQKKLLSSCSHEEMLMKLTPGADAIKKFTPSFGIPSLGV